MEVLQLGVGLLSHSSVVHSVFTDQRTSQKEGRYNTVSDSPSLWELMIQCRTVEPLYFSVLKIFPVNTLISFYELINFYQQQHQEQRGL